MTMPCTCLGECKGAEGLGKAWHCVLQQQVAVVVPKQSDPVGEVDAMHKAIVSHVQEGCKATDQLRTIRATLLVNFGNTKHNRYGFTIEDRGSTHDLMYQVLDKLTSGKFEPAPTVKA